MAGKTFTAEAVTDFFHVPLLFADFDIISRFPVPALFLVGPEAPSGLQLVFDWICVTPNPNPITANLNFQPFKLYELVESCPKFVACSCIATFGACASCLAVAVLAEKVS